MKVEACCKINIGLHVIRRREDGYHDISTLMYPVKGLCDTLQVDASSDDSFSCEGIEVDCPPQDNLCIRAYRLLKDEFGTGSAAIRLGKRIPFGAGLGGGSSDAAAVLCAMNRIYGLGLDSEALERRAALLGSDTSFFVRSVPRICSGRGEIMTDCPIDLSGLYILLVKPPYGVSAPSLLGNSAVDSFTSARRAFDREHRHVERQSLQRLRKDGIRDISGAYADKKAHVRNGGRLCLHVRFGFRHLRTVPRKADRGFRFRHVQLCGTPVKRQKVYPTEKSAP